MRVHFIADTEVPCGKHSAPDTTRHPADVTCKACQQWLRTQQAYRDGWSAFRDGVQRNPHKPGILHREWTQGYQSAQRWAE